MRYLLLDRITKLEPGAAATAVKCISLADDVFLDHFPGHPVMPGALVLESLAQLGGTLLEATIRARGHAHLHALLTMVYQAKFRLMVRPGDRLELETTVERASEDGGVVKGTAHVDGRLAAEAELGFAFAPITNPALVRRRQEIVDIWMAGMIGDSSRE